MFEAGSLLLLLFLGCCSLIAVALLLPNHTLPKIVDEAHAFKGKSPTAPKNTQAENAERSVGSRVKYYLRCLAWWIACLGDEEMEDSEALYLTFSAEEVGKIAVLIIQKVERKVAIRSMPRYSRKQHKEFASFYDQLKAAMEHGQKEE